MDGVERHPAIGWIIENTLDSLDEELGDRLLLLTATVARRQLIVPELEQLMHVLSEYPTESRRVARFAFRTPGAYQ